MNIAFLVNRHNFVRDFFCIIEKALSANHKIYILYFDDYDAKYQTQNLIEIPISMNDKVRMVKINWDTLTDIAFELSLDFIICLEGLKLVHNDNDGSKKIPEKLTKLKSSGIKLISVCHFHEVAHEPFVWESILIFDKVCYPSDFIFDYHLSMNNAIKEQLPANILKRVAITGIPILDQGGGLDKLAIKKKYEIPTDKKIVLFMSLKMQVGDCWRKFAFGEKSRIKGLIKSSLRLRIDLFKEVLLGIKYESFMDKVKEFCKRNDAVLIIKSRKKNFDPPYVKSASEFYFFDESYFPDTSAELLAISDLCFHFQSASVMEAAAAKVPSVSIDISQEHIKKWNSQWYDTWFKSLSVHDFAGVVYKREVKELYRQLPDLMLEDFPIYEDARVQYIKKYIGFNDFNASGRILNLIGSNQ